MARHNKIAENNRTLRPKRMMAGLLAGKTIEQAALDAGYSETTAKQEKSAMQTLRNQYISRLADRLTPDELVEIMVDGLKSCSVEPFLHQKSGQVVYSEALPDRITRLKYLELGSRILGLLVRNVEVTGTGPNGEIELSVALRQARKRIEQADADAQIVSPPQDVVVGHIADRYEELTPSESTTTS